MTPQDRPLVYNVRCNLRLRYRRILFVVLLLAGIGEPFVCQSAVSMWTWWEQSLTCAKVSANPAGGAHLKVSYRGPNGQAISGLGFWDGERTFRIRCLFPRPGNWTWQTTCVDTNDAGLHNRTGLVDVLPFTGSNPLYQHGYLRVAESRRYLTHADGTPFLWIGDTPWAAPMNAKMEDWHYATKRMVLAKSAAGDVAVAYLPDNPAITIKMTAFAAPMRSDWYNPKTGAWERGKPPAKDTGQNTFKRPLGWEDALLVLRKASTSGAPQAGPRATSQ